MANVKIPCGGFEVDGTSLVFATVDDKKILSTSVKKKYPHIEKVPCGGFYFDADVFKVIGDTLTKADADTVDATLEIPCGGYLCDSAVFKFNKVLSYIGK